MNTSRGFPILFLILCTCLLAVPPANAQYIFVDLNGDGLNTPLDVLTGVLPVNVDVYLQTSTNRDGSPATCAGGGSLSVGSFEFALHSIGGTVQWGALTGGLFAVGSQIKTANNAVDFYVGRFDTLGVYVPAGQVLLGTLPVTALTGTPLLRFATTTPLSAKYTTSFGSQCAGADSEYTMALGRDWQDADGTFGTVLANVSGTVFLDKNGVSGGNCLLDAGEPGVPGWVVTLSPGGQQALTDRTGSYKFQNVPPGIYTAQLTTPGTWRQTCPSVGAGQPVTVLLGQTYPGLNFGVKPANMPPLLQAIPSKLIAPGKINNVALQAADPDGTPLTFSLLNGPSFATVTTTGPGRGNLQLAPLAADEGKHSLTVGASDGVYDSRRSATYTVLSPTAVTEHETSGPIRAEVVPNPMNPAGVLTFSTSRSGFLRVSLYDATGKRVRTLVDRKSAPASLYQIPIDARDAAGKALASGVYFFKIETPGDVQSGRAVVLK
jgi:hypothetical protein